MTGPASRRAVLPGVAVLALVGLAVVIYVVLGYASAFATANAYTQVSPVGLLFLAAAASMLATAWGLWSGARWSRTSGRAAAALIVLAGLAVLGYLVLLTAIAPDAAATAIGPLGGGGTVALIAGVLVWRSASAVHG